MPPIIGLSGHSGSGKSTAITYLCSVSQGESIYLGRAVLAEVEKRGLAHGREAEREVRIAMREEHGEACLVMASLESIRSLVGSGRAVFVDAIFCPEEFSCLVNEFGENAVRVLRIEASFDIRAARLRARSDRPFSPQELKMRDEIESTRLGTTSVFAAAAFTIHNEADLMSFHAELDAWWRTLSTA